jgi:hypothetical protein
MGTTLTGTTPQDTYDSLIKVTDNGPLSGSLKKLTDGLGNDSSLSLSTTAASLSGTLGVGGDVKLGTATTGTPSANADDLVIDKGASESGITIISTAAATLRFGDAANTSIGSIEYDHSGDYMRFNTSGSEKVRITSAGNVGIGTSSPASKLHVYGGDSFLGLDWASANYDATPRQFRIASNGNNSGYITQAAYNSSATAATTFFRSYVNAASSGALVFESGAGDFNTNSGIPASYTERFRITNNGVTFNGDTAAANALDDYEEGTFTPTLTASGGNPTVTYATGNTGGIYTKVGNKVTVSFEVRWTALSGGSGEVQISGMPFTRRTTTTPDGERTIIDSYNNTIDGKYLTGTIGSNTTRVDIINVNSAAALSPLDVTDLPTSSLGLLRGTITYFV